jgi:hypothetical protein
MSQARSFIIAEAGADAAFYATYVWDVMHHVERVTAQPKVCTIADRRF